MKTDLTLRQELVLLLGDEEIKNAAKGPPQAFTSQQFGERLADRVLPLLTEVYQLWTDELERGNHLHARLQEEIARATRAEAALREQR